MSVMVMLMSIHAVNILKNKKEHITIFRDLYSAAWF
jgi:hypothetical protein